MEEELVKKIDRIAIVLGFKVERVVNNVAYYHYEGMPNDKGEKLGVSISYCSGTKDPKSLPMVWYKKGYTKELMLSWWGVDTWVTNKEGRCYRAYDPTIKLSFDMQRYVIDFDWHLSPTEQNFRKIMNEILSRYYF